MQPRSEGDVVGAGVQRDPIFRAEEPSLMIPRAEKRSPMIPRAETPGLLRRLCTMSYEFLLLLGVLAAAFMLPHLVLGVIWHVLAPEWLLWLHVIAVLMAYFVWCWRKAGQTLAMRTWNIKLVAANGTTPVPLRQAVLRYALSWPSLLLCGIGLAWALVDRDRQFLHDRLAGTRLVRV